jgi:hypothetical protein
MGTPIRLGRFKLRKLNLRDPFTWFGFGKELLLEEDHSRRGPADGNNNTILRLTHRETSLCVAGLCGFLRDSLCRLYHGICVLCLRCCPFAKEVSRLRLATLAPYECYLNCLS